VSAGVSTELTKAHSASAKKEAAPAYKHVDRVEVSLWGRFMGAVALDPGYGYYAFRYTPEFQATGIQPSPLNMPANENRTFIFTDLPEITYHRLPSMLSDALPDDFGNALIDKYMADHGIAVSDVTVLDRLAYMSNRAIGALTFRPSRGPRTQKPIALELSNLVTEARKVVSGTLDTDGHANAALRSIIEVGTSAGGARAKAVIAWNPKTHEIRAGQLDAPPGFEHWLLKFDGMGEDRELGTPQGYGRIEYGYYLMAKRAGIEMTECRLQSEHDRSHFMTKRFDRDAGNVRHHIQTLCALAHLDYKKKGTNAYSQLFSTISALSLPYADMEEAFRRMVFNVMGRNCDDHTKNFSFRLREGQAWELAPGYDLTFAHNPKGEWTNQHLMAVNGKFKDFVEGDLLAEAERFGIGTGDKVITQVRAAIKGWPAFAEEAGVSPADARTIGQQHLLLST
jgi:serine/threonine-protein kinase HipA